MALQSTSITDPGPLSQQLNIGLGGDVRGQFKDFSIPDLPGGGTASPGEQFSTNGGNVATPVPGPPTDRTASGPLNVAAFDPTQGGEGAGPNPSGGVAGSQSPGSSGLLGGLLGGDFSNLSGVNLAGSALSGLVGEMMGGVPATSLIGIIGALAQSGVLGPSFGNVNSLDAAINSLNAGALSASEASFEDPGSTAQARAAAAIQAANDFSATVGSQLGSAGMDLGTNPGIQGSTGFSGAASTAATGDTVGDVGNTGGADSSGGGGGGSSAGSGRGGGEGGSGGSGTGEGGAERT